SVAATHARRGLGRALIEHAAGLARERGAPCLTLTTFAQVPWNAPYYERIGFRTLDENELSPGLRAIRDAEAAHGLASGRGSACGSTSDAPEPAARRSPGAQVLRSNTRRRPSSASSCSTSVTVRDSSATTSARIPVSTTEASARPSTSSRSRFTSASIWPA